MACPHCQTHSEVPPSRDLKDFPTSFYLNGLINVLAIKECKKTQITCGNCVKSSFETSYCFKCCIFFCGKCADAHNILQEHKDHRILAVKDFQDKDCEDVLKRPVFCPKPLHEKQELNYFCKDCKATVCQMCCTLEHSGHALEHIKVEAATQKEEMRNLVETRRQNLQTKKNVVLQLDKDCAHLFQQGEAVKKDVQTFTDNLMVIIEAQRQNIFEAVERLVNSSIESLTNEKRKVEAEIKAMESSLEIVEKLFTQSTDIDVLRQRTSLEKILVQNSRNEPVIRALESITAIILPFEKNEKLLNIVEREKIGALIILHQTKASQSIAEGENLNEAFAGREARFTLTTKNAEGRQCYNKRDQITVEIRDEQEHECEADVEVNDSKSGAYNISYSPRAQGKYFLIVKVNEQHVRGSPFILLVKARERPISRKLTLRRKKGGRQPVYPGVPQHYFSELAACSQNVPETPFHFKSVLCFGENGSSEGTFNHPWGVAVSDADDIAVSDCMNNRVQLFDSRGKYLKSFGSEMSNHGEFIHPRGLCFDDNRNIFIADSGNHRVQIWNPEGSRLLGMFGGKGRGDNELYDPCGLSVDARENIIVADSGNKVIKIFSTDGRFVRKIGSPKSLSFPVHCVQLDRYFIVSDYHDHRIKVFNWEGEFESKFGTQGKGEGKFKFPCCLSLNKSQHLMVCDEGNNRIQIFQPNGRFLSMFGTGEEFNHPKSVALLSNGRVVVSEWGNHRIQILQ